MRIMSLDQDTNSAAYLTDSERDMLITRMKVAWNALPPDKQAALKPVLDEAHLQLGNYLNSGAPPQEHIRPLLQMKSYLTDDWDGHLDSLRLPSPTDEVVAAEAIEQAISCTASEVMRRAPASIL
jgi:hypothetical protein